MKRGLLFKIFLSIGVVFLFACFYFAYTFFAPNISPRNIDDPYLYIYPESTLEEVLNSLEENAVIRNKSSFKRVAKILDYDKQIRTGKYKIPKNTNNLSFIRKLRSKSQTPVKVTFNNIRTKEQLAGRFSSLLMADSSGILNLLNDALFLEKYGLNPNTSVAVFIPNTYEFFWDVDAEQIFQRMSREYNKFWTKERSEKAAAIPLSAVEVSILASIVEEETNKSSERPIVAGLYINRLQKGMALQADPTVKFAVGDFGLKRILKIHLETDSPYNTYKYAGLPPGPIRCPSPNSIDAVLNFQHNNYLYMCAKETLNGEHNFAVTFSEHQKNARKYQRALNSRKIYK